MAEKGNMPAIRFKGFSDEWEEYKIGDVLTEKKRPIELEDETTYQLVTVKRRNEGVVSRCLLKGKYILVKNYFEINAGDYLISKRQVVHGANGIVPNNLNMAVVSNEYLVIIGNEKITAEFWTIISKLPEIHKKFFLSSYGVDIEKLVFDVEDWKKRTVKIPILHEQNRILCFFNQLENLISLNQAKLKKLVNLKKAMLEKMFPKQGADVPEIRFKGFEEAWEEKKLGDIAQFNPKSELPDVFEYVDLESVIGTEMVSHREETKKTHLQEHRDLPDKVICFTKQLDHISKIIIFLI